MDNSLSERTNVRKVGVLRRPASAEKSGKADVDGSGKKAFILSMELDLFDAVRSHIVIEFDAHGVRYRAEPYKLIQGPSGDILRAFVTEGPKDGWADFSQWENLKITRTRFQPRVEYHS